MLAGSGGGAIIQVEDELLGTGKMSRKLMMFATEAPMKPYTLCQSSHMPRMKRPLVAFNQDFQDLHLHGVGVLILVHQQMSEHATVFFSDQLVFIQ